MFVSPTNLHCSQTHCQLSFSDQRFVSPTNLHCSQTAYQIGDKLLCLFPLQIYTTLKHAYDYELLNDSLFPLQIYTTLKRKSFHGLPPFCLFPLQIYTTLKPQIIQEKYLRNICVTFIVYWKHFYFNIKYIDLHPL